MLLSGAILGHGDVQAKTTAGAMSGSVDLLQSESLLMSGSYGFLENGLLPWTMLVSRSQAATGAIVISRPGLLPRTRSGPMVLPQLGSVLKFMAQIATRD